MRPPPPGISSRLRPPSPGIFWLRSLPGPKSAVRPRPGGDILVAPLPAGPKSAVRPGPGGDISGCAPPRPARNVHSELRLDVVSQTVRQSVRQSDSQSGDGRGIKPGFAGNDNGKEHSSAYMTMSSSSSPSSWPRIVRLPRNRRPGLEPSSVSRGTAVLA